MASSYSTNSERTNYSRISRALIDLSADVLRHVLSVNVLPVNIKNVLRKNIDYTERLSIDQKVTINNAAAKRSYEEFDITLLCLAIRLISVQELRISLSTLKDLHTAVQSCQALTSDPSTKLSPQELVNVKAASISKSYDKCRDDLIWKLHKFLCPTLGKNIIHPSGNWGHQSFPDQSCLTLGDDIERIRLLRNKVYGHRSDTKISDHDFKKYWEILENIMSRMDQRMTGGKYRSSLDTIKVDCMDDTTERKYCEEISKMVETEKEIKTEVENVKKEIVEIKAEGGSIQTGITDMNNEIESLKADMRQTKTDFTIAIKESKEENDKTNQILLTCVANVNSMSQNVNEIAKKVEMVDTKMVETEHAVDDVKENLQIVKDTVLHGKVDPQRMYKNNMLQQIEKHRKDKTFVITDAVYKGKDILKEHGILIISGIPGQGKTKNSLEIIKQLQDENKQGTFIELEDIRKWNSVIDPFDHPVVLLNDVIGKTNIDTGLLNEGDSHWRTIESCIENGNVKVIITVRKDLLDKNMLKLEKYKLFDQEYTIDLTSDKYKLNEEIKTEIIKQHCISNGIEICNFFEENFDKVDITDTNTVIKLDEHTISKIVKTDPLLGFPLTAHLFCCKRKYTQLGVNFFKKPTQYLLEEINHLASSEASYIEKVQYCIMTLMALTDGKYESESLDLELFNRIIKSVELQKTPKNRDIKEAIELLLDRYLVKGIGCQYEFKHQTVLESIAVCFYQDDPDLLIELCSKKFIVEFVRHETFQPTEAEVVCKIDSKVYKTLINRFLYWLKHEPNEDEKENQYQWLIKHPLMDDEIFVDLFIDMCKKLVLQCSDSMFQLACEHGKTYYLDKLFNLCTAEKISLSSRGMLCVYTALIYEHKDTAVWLLNHKFVTEYDLYWSLSLPNPSLIKHSSVTLTHVIDNIERICARSDSEVVKAIFSRWPELKEDQVLKMFECFIFYGSPTECLDALITCRPDIVTDKNMEKIFLIACVGLFNSIKSMKYMLSINNDRTKLLVFRNRENLTYLHIAAFFGRYDVCMKLIELGLQLDGRTKTGLSVQQMVILGYCCRSAGAFVSKVRCFNQASHTIYNDKAVCIIQERSEILKYCCQVFYQKLHHYNLVACSNTPSSNYMQLFEYIRTNSAEFKETDFDLIIDAFGSKIIHYCVLYDDMATLKMLNNVNNTFVHAKNAEGLSNLHIAAVYGKLDIFMKLVEFGLCVSSRSYNSKLSALQMALMGFTLQDFYVDFCPLRFLFLQSRSFKYYCKQLGNAIISFGNKASYEQIINILVEHKDFRETDFNKAVDFYGNSITHYCVAYDSLYILQLLGRKYPRALSGKNVIAEERFPFSTPRRLITPIELSILMGRSEIFHYLLSHVNGRDIERFTELLSEGRNYIGSKFQHYDQNKPNFLYFLEPGTKQIDFGDDNDFTSIFNVIQNLQDESEK